MSHTKEPWRIDADHDEPDVDIVKTEGLAICLDVDRDNACRIVACVNACAGISTGELERGKAISEFDHMKLMAQRDELLAALGNAMAKVKSATSCHPNALRYLLDEAMEICGAAIASAKGGA